MESRKQGSGAEREGRPTVCKLFMGKLRPAGGEGQRHSSQWGQGTSHSGEGQLEGWRVGAAVGGREQPCSAKLSSVFWLQKLQPGLWLWLGFWGRGSWEVACRRGAGSRQES